MKGVGQCCTMSMQLCNICVKGSSTRGHAECRAEVINQNFINHFAAHLAARCPQTRASRGTPTTLRPTCSCAQRSSHLPLRTRAAIAIQAAIKSLRLSKRMRALKNTCITGSVRLSDIGSLSQPCWRPIIIIIIGKSICTVLFVSRSSYSSAVINITLTSCYIR